MSDIRVTKEMPYKCELCEYLKKEFTKYACTNKKHKHCEVGFYHFLSLLEYCPLPKEPTETKVNYLERIQNIEGAIVNLSKTFIERLEVLEKAVLKPIEVVADDRPKESDPLTQLVDLQVENSKLKTLNQSLLKSNQVVDERERKALIQIEELKTEKDQIITELNYNGLILNDGKIYKASAGTIKSEDITIQLTKEDIILLYFCCQRVVETEKMNMFRMTLPKVQEYKSRNH